MHIKLYGCRQIDATNGKDKMIAKITSGTNDLLGEYPIYALSNRRLIIPLVLAKLRFYLINSIEINRVRLREFRPRRIYNARRSE